MTKTSEGNKSSSIRSEAHLNLFLRLLHFYSGALPPLARRRAGRQVGVTSTNPETSGQVGGGLRAPSILAAAHFPCPPHHYSPPGGEAQAMMSSWVANTKHINIVLMIIIIMA